MKIGTPVVEFLGATIGSSTIKLQTHIISKIADFKESELETIKGLRSWLGLLNYARSYIPNLGRLLGPLYAKTSLTGERRMNSQDWMLIRKIKDMISTLPDLAIPPEECFIILETDGCMEGWGDICKWKLKKDDPHTEERICAYASGKAMASSRRRLFSLSPSRGNTSATLEEAQYQSIPTPGGPYELLDQYEELVGSPSQGIIGLHEKDLREHLGDIEWTASSRVLKSIWELKLIINSKEADFAHRGQLRGGLYFKDTLPEVTKAKEELLDLFIKAQNVAQRIKDVPP
ncbi:hypothetical protein ZIOFF_024290 [Zingiber officinale]|uniref:Polyprotein n=1 Tax=Zingiber officinale TaxID=94328 RepID=A0A8J5GTC6_ZINOF|nr:hypothetical protein ZIOFF_024290 [Zingiber officinale]